MGLGSQVALFEDKAFEKLHRSFSISPAIFLPNSLLSQWSFLVPLIGGIGTIYNPPIGSFPATYKPLIYILPIGWLYITYMDVSENSGTPKTPKMIIFSRKTQVVGYHHLRKHLYTTYSGNHRNSHWLSQGSPPRSLGQPQRGAKIPTRWCYLKAHGIPGLPRGFHCYL